MPFDLVLHVPNPEEKEHNYPGSTLLCCSQDLCLVYLRAAPQGPWCGFTTKCLGLVCVEWEWVGGVCSRMTLSRGSGDVMQTLSGRTSFQRAGS